MSATLIPKSLKLSPQIVAPSSPVGGQIYLDGTVSPAVYKQWNDVTLAWEIFGANITATAFPVARASLSAGASFAAGVPINFDTIDFDTFASITVGASWKFTAPQTGYYSVSVVLDHGGGSDGDIELRKNGTTNCYLTYANTSPPNIASGSAIIQLNAGDYIHVSGNGASTTYTGGTPPSTLISISQIAALSSASSIAASAYMATNTAVGSNAVIPWDTEYFDTNNALAAGIFTAPVTGFYQVTGTIQISVASTDLQSYKNGSLLKYLGTIGILNITYDYNDLVQLNAGDTYSIVSASATTINSAGSTPLSSLNIVLISAEAGLTAPVRVSAYRSTNQVLAANDTIVFDTVVSDINSLYNSGTGVITIADTGAYSLSGVFQASSGTPTIAAKVNGTAKQYMCGVTTVVASSYIVLDLVAGDTVEIIGDSAGTIVGTSAPELTSFTLLKL